MALIKCPECGREGVSDKAKSCPTCGFPLSESSQGTPMIAPVYKESFLSDKDKSPLILLLIISGLMFIRMISILVVTSGEKEKLEALVLPSAIEYITTVEQSDTISKESLHNDMWEIYEKGGVEKVAEQIKNDTPYSEIIIARIGAYICFLIIIAAFAIDTFVLKHWNRKTFIGTHLFIACILIFDIIISSVILSWIDKNSILMDSYTKDIGLDSSLTSPEIIGIILSIIVVIAFFAIARFTKKRIDY